jgi:transcriptional regulator with XRE-family HTH domain
MVSVDSLIGSRLRQLRERLGVSVEYFAESVGIGVVDLLEYEAGKLRIPAELVVQICTRHAVTVESLLGGI